MNKFKYLGVCATALLTIAPVATSAVAFAFQPVVTDVRAEVNSDYQSSLDNGFNSNASVSLDQLSGLTDLGGDYSSGNGNIVYDNVGNSNSLFSTSTDAYAKLYDKLNNSLLRLLVKDGAIVGFLSNSNYRTTMNVTGDKITPATGSGDLIHQLQTLSSGQTFKVTLTTRDSAGDVKGTKVINVTVVNNPAKISLGSIPSRRVDNGSATSQTENGSDNAAVIKDYAGRQIFSAIELNSAVNNSTYYYQKTGSSALITKDYRNYDLTSNNTVEVVKQYIPVPYTKEISDRYNARDFVFLTQDANDQNLATITNTPVTPGSNAVAYVIRRIIIGNVTDKSYPVFRYGSTDANGTTTISTVKDGQTLTPNKVDAASLSYTYNDQNSLDQLKNYLEGKFQTTTDGAGNFKAYNNIDTVDSNNSEVGTIKFILPPVDAKTGTQYVLASVTNNTTGIEATVKIPVTVKGIPNAAVAPTITKFPENSQVTVNSKSTTKYDAKADVAATYLDANGATQTLPAANISISVKNANGSDVVLNSDGTVPTTTSGTYTVHYTFTNPNDTSKVATKDLTLTVSSSDLVAPTVTGFKDNATYTLSNNQQKEVSPFASVLGMSDVKASYVGSDGATHTLDPNKVTFKITNKQGQTVALNSNKLISMTTPDTLTINYIWTNPDDPTKTVTKTSTLVINSVVSQPITAKYSGSETANPKVMAGTPFNVLNNMSFTYSYTDPSTSTPTTPITETVPNNFVSVKVTKDGVNVPLSSNTFATSAGTYNISYSITNPKDNATTLNYTRTLTVQQSTGQTPALEDKDGVLWIKYVPGYGVNLWKTPGVTGGAETLPDGSYRKLKHGTAWKYFQTATYPDGSKWYKLGNNQWVSALYVSLVGNTDDSWNVQPVTGVGVINYVPGYGVNVWTTPDQKLYTKKLPDGTAWQFFKIATNNGKTMYNLGGNQWVDSQYFVPKG
ncbi:hypothetical protein [Xylocopilactobacillus apicola]|uniref:Uncharacterized protein n=1 Tax=Xylocopilactobacillus apicola TaxID=2932184 RepID=A0AAU9D9A4_9LACO|nr:hypothetical protein [Xylocopilactobacillus apicola]BDR58991.1 hypothetical protein XA3_14320 [Xylocopilactobacillus apicola]